MKYLFQFAILCAIYYIGELLVQVTGLPVPGSVVGLVLLFLLLRLGWIRRDQVDTTAMYLIQVFPVMFIPVTTALMVSYGLLTGHVAAFFGVTLVSTVVVLGATGRTTQWLMRREHRRLGERPDGEDSE